MDSRDDQHRPFYTDAGVSDADMETGEPVAGRGSARDQEEASTFYEELGAIVEGKEGAEVHTAERGSSPVDTRPFVTDAGVSDGVVETTDEHLTGQAGRDDQDEASDFFEEIGAVIEGKTGDDIHQADMED